METEQIAVLRLTLARARQTVIDFTNHPDGLLFRSRAYDAWVRLVEAERAGQA
jgi:hypothetical protein